MIRSVIACEIEKEKKKNTPPIYFRQTPSLLSLSLSLSPHLHVADNTKKTPRQRKLNQRNESNFSHNGTNVLWILEP